MDHHTVAAIRIAGSCLDVLPPRALGAFGIALIFVGFTLQSLQYWLALFDVKMS